MKLASKRLGSAVPESYHNITLLLNSSQISVSRVNSVKGNQQQKEPAEGRKNVKSSKDNETHSHACLCKG